MAAKHKHCSSWSDFQPELLGLVLRRLPSLADRVRLRAVCRQWRHHARLEPAVPPPLPWLSLLDGTFLSVPDGEVHRLHVPDGAVYNHGSTGNWLFYSDINGMCSLVNPFSKAAAIQLLRADIIWNTGVDRRRNLVYLKWVLLSSSLEPSPNSHFAVLIRDNEHDIGISICQPQMASAFRVPNHERLRILDIAFFDGKLYALSRKKLFAIDIDSNCYSGKPKIIPSMRCVVDSIDDPGTKLQYFVNKGYRCMYWGYLAECSGRLLHIRRLLGVLSTMPENNMLQQARTLSFDVFEADLITSSCGQWKRVNTLGAQALFVGRHSKCLPASEYGAQEDCIYFICDYDWGDVNEDPFRDCGVFNVRNEMVMPLLPEAAVVRPQGKSGPGHPAWFFPE